MFKSLILFRKYSLGLVIAISLAFVGLMFRDYEKVLISIKSDFSFYDLITTVPFLLIIFFLVGSLVIVIVYLFNPNLITSDVIVEYEAWFFTSIFTYFSYNFCRISLQVNNLLISNSYVDMLFQNPFLSVKRLWSREELAKIVEDIISSHNGITFTEAEVSEILTSNSVESVISRTEGLSKIKLEQLTDIEIPASNSLWNDFWCFIASHPVEVIVISLVLITFGISFYRNYTEYTPNVEFTTQSLSSLESRVTALEGALSHLTRNRDNMVGVREFIRETKEAFTINTSAFRQLRDRVDNLYKHLDVNPLPTPNPPHIPQLDADNIFGPPVNPLFPGLGHILGDAP